MTSLIDLGNLSEPLTKLVEVVASGIGVLYNPIDKILVAKAEGRALVINAEAKEKSLAARAEARIRWQEELRQKNVEAVVSIAAEEMDNNVSSDPVDPDWTLQFFDGAQNVCDEDMRKLWGRILAGEVAHPGKFSKRTVHFLKTLDKTEAMAFSAFCGYLFNTGSGLSVLEESITRKVMRDQMGNQDWITHFISIGLLSASSYSYSASTFTGKKILYFDQELVFDGPSPPAAKSGIASLELDGYFRDLTQIGQQLAMIAEPTPVEGFVRTISERMHEIIGVSLKVQNP